MKMHLLRISILAVTAVLAARGQTSYYRVTVPFEFGVNNQVLPAGQYSVGFNMASGLMSLACVDHKGFAGLVGFPLPAPFVEHGKKLVFHRYTNTYFHTNTYFLTQVWADDAFRKELSMTKRERELAVRMSNPDTISIAATR